MSKSNSLPGSAVVKTPRRFAGTSVLATVSQAKFKPNAIAAEATDPAQPGFKHIVMKSYTPGDLKSVSASYHSLRGLIVSEWQKGEDKFNWHITIPPNTTATVLFQKKAPTGYGERITGS